MGGDVANKKGSLASRINFGGKNKAQEKPKMAGGTMRSYGNMMNQNLDKAKKLYAMRKRGA